MILGIGADDIFVLYDAFMQVNSFLCGGAWWCMVVLGGIRCTCDAMSSCTRCFRGARLVYSWNRPSHTMQLYFDVMFVMMHPAILIGSCTHTF